MIATGKKEQLTDKDRNSPNTNTSITMYTMKIDGKVSLWKI